MKVIELKIPRGPLIGKLKAGETVTLGDGRTVKPEQVYVEETEPGGEQPTLLVVEVDSPEKLDCIRQSPLLEVPKRTIPSPTTLKGKRVNYVAHFTRQAMVETAEYKRWMESFGTACQHLVLNGTGEAFPLSYGPYRQQTMHHQLCPDVFPLLHPDAPLVVGQVVVR